MYEKGAPLPRKQLGAPAIRSGRRVRSGLLALGLSAGLGVNLAQQATAQALTVLHHFTTTAPYTNLDGATPNGFVLSGSTLYGTTQVGGSRTNGTVFRVNTDGSGFTNLYEFGSVYNNYDGTYPHANLILSGNTLYGTTSGGGFSGVGTVFAVNTDGTGFTNLLHFLGTADGYGDSPQAALLLAGNTLYGTASRGGASGVGAVFSVNTDRTDITLLHSFAGGSDGAYPYSSLILVGNTLYGTASSGGTYGAGTIFRVNTNGSSFTNFYSFTGGSDGAAPYAGLIYSAPSLYGASSGGGGSSAGTVFFVQTNGFGFNTLHTFTGNDGRAPRSALLLSGTMLYGTASAGGGSSAGTVFALNTGGSGFTNLHGFSGGSDGASPSAALVLSGSTLYGATPSGGGLHAGTAFAVNTNSTGFTTLHTFTPASGTFKVNSDGAYPYAGLDLAGSTLYGTAQNGGGWGDGTVFAVNTDGTGFSTLHTLFGPTDGSYPTAELVNQGNILYGTTSQGGSSSNGTVFAVDIFGIGFTNLHTFTNSPDGANPSAGVTLSGATLFGTASSGGGNGAGTVFAISNSSPFGLTDEWDFGSVYDTTNFLNLDGYSPNGLIISGNTLYGTASAGGQASNGTVFAFLTDGQPTPTITNWIRLHSFAPGHTNSSGVLTNSDGAAPYAGLLLAGGRLYGTTSSGGKLGNGTLFAVNTNGTGFTNLHTFTASPTNAAGLQTNSDGAFPYGGLILSGSNLYGTTFLAGPSDSGTVFALNTNGTGFTVLYSFSANNFPPYYTNSDGSDPIGSLRLSGHFLFGATAYGGNSGNGTVFSLNLSASPALAQTNSPGLAVQLTGTNCLVADPSPGFGLTTTATFEAWVNPTAVACNTILSRGNGLDTLTDYIFQVGYDGTNCGVMKIGFFGAGAWDSSTSTVPLNTWTHVAVTFDGFNKRFYINGVLDSTAPRCCSLYVAANSPLYLGRQGSACNCNFFQGQMDEVRIWNIVRTPAQISQNFRQSLNGTEPGLVAYYRFDEAGGPALDASGNGNTATPTGGTVWTNSGAPMIAPIVTTLGTSNVLPASATLHASVNPNNQPTWTWFDYGLTTNYGSSTPQVALSATNANLAVTAIANGLTPNQTYQYRIVAANGAGTNFGVPHTFQTLTAIVLLSPNIGTGGYFGFTLSGPTGFNYNIDFSADLSNWATLSTLSNATGLFPFLDTNTPASIPRFYRARLLP